MSPGWITFRIIAVFFGGGLIVISLFVYEDDERKLINSIEELWIKMDDIRIKLTSFHEKLLYNSFAVTNNILSKIFGQKAFSLQFLAVSTNLSLASVWLLTSFTPERFDNYEERYISISL